MDHKEIAESWQKVRLSRKRNSGGREEKENLKGKRRKILETAEEELYKKRNKKPCMQ